MSLISRSIRELREFDWREIATPRNSAAWPTAVRLAIVALLMVALLATGYLWRLRDIRERGARLGLERAELAAERDRLRGSAATLDDFRQRAREIEEPYMRMLRRLPYESEIPALIDEISALGLNFGLDIDSIELADELDRPHYVEQPIAIRVRGGYHDIGAFFSGVASLDRIVTLHDFSLDEAASDDPGDSAELALELLARTYRYRPLPESAAESETAAAGSQPPFQFEWPQPEPSSYAAGARLNPFAPQPAPPPVSAPQIEEPSGAGASLSFQDVPIRFALQTLADEGGFNLVAGEAVAGNISLRLDQVPWEQALELVLRAGNLAHRMEGNVLFVTTAEEMALRLEQELEAERRALVLTPLVTELLQVNYADAAILLELVLGAGAAGADADSAAAEPDAATSQTGNRGLLSARGSAVVDVRTNTIIVRDMEQNLAAIRDLLASLDVPVRQVLIEARIVNVATDYSREFGVRWAAAGAPEAGGGFRYGIAQGLAPAQAGNELALDLGIGSKTTFNIGYSGGSELIELELAAIESSGNGEIIARPKVTTQDKVTAEIRSGVRIPYQSQAGGTAGGSITQFEDAVLLLRVTPRITPNGQINMQLEIRQDSISPTAVGVPSINTNEVITSALVDDGETIVLGGVFREEATSTESKTPILGDVPLLEHLFKRTLNDTRRTELLIFITPGIVPATP